MATETWEAIETDWAVEKERRHSLFRWLPSLLCFAATLGIGVWQFSARHTAQKLAGERWTQAQHRLQMSYAQMSAATEANNALAFSQAQQEAAADVNELHQSIFGMNTNEWHKRQEFVRRAEDCMRGRLIASAFHAEGTAISCKEFLQSQP